MEPWPRNPAVTEHAAEVGAPAATFYLASGPEDGPLVVFVHGWPELSISWRHQLPCLGALGFRAVAPDMRGYGRSYIPSTHEEVAHEHTTADLIGLLDALRGPGSQAVFVGHDWGSPIVWSLAAHFPERCFAVANLCVGHGGPSPEGAPTMPEALSAAPDALQWDYQLLHQEPANSAQGLNEGAISHCFQPPISAYFSPMLAYFDLNWPALVLFGLILALFWHVLGLFWPYFGLCCAQTSLAPFSPCSRVSQTTTLCRTGRMWNKYMTMFDQRKRFGAIFTPF